MFVNRLIKYLFSILFLLTLNINYVFSASYPDFTAIVEKNMPAVVIVNATRSINNATQNQFQTPPGDA